VVQQGLVLAYNDTLLLMAGCFLLSLPLVLLLQRPKKAGGGGEAH